MKMRATAAIAVLIASSPALACQPPRDMPADPAAAAQYWERARTGWEKHVVSQSPVLVVAKVSARLGGKDLVPMPPDAPYRFTLTAIKVLRGAPGRKLVGEYSNHMCDDFKVGVAQGGVYLLAMNGERILVAAPLIEGQERDGVGKFFTRIGEPDPWD